MIYLRGDEVWCGGGRWGALGASQRGAMLGAALTEHNDSYITRDGKSYREEGCRKLKECWLCTREERKESETVKRRRQGEQREITQRGFRKKVREYLYVRDSGRICMK